MNGRRRLPQFHPTAELLMEYAAGSLREPYALVVATHLTLCPACRTDVAAYEAVGGVMLEDIEPVPLAADSLDTLMARLPAPLPRAPKVAAPPVEHSVPQPLRALIGDDLEDLPWRRRHFGPAVVDILRPGPGTSARLMRLPAGGMVPRHTHGGLEVIMVLQGTLIDGCRLEPGDVAVADTEVEHNPMADVAGPCICLVAVEAPLRLTGPIGRFIQLFRQS